ncbi:DUF1654 domain-containing protein [Stutzerimonas chloritidismutans]
MPGPAVVTNQRQLSSYSRLVRRVNLTITAPTAQRERQANLRPGPSDRPEDWERLLEEIEQADNVTMRRRPDGSVHVIWTGSEH